MCLWGGGGKGGDVMCYTCATKQHICVNICTYININASISVSNIHAVHSIKNLYELLSRTWPNLLFPSSFLTMLIVTFSLRSLKISEQIDMLGQLLSSNGIDVKVNKYNILSKVSTSVPVHASHSAFSLRFYTTDLSQLTFINISVTSSFSACVTIPHLIWVTHSLTHSLNHSLIVLNLHHHYYEKCTNVIISIQFCS